MGSAETLRVWGQLGPSVYGVSWDPACTGSAGTRTKRAWDQPGPLVGAPSSSVCGVSQDLLEAARLGACPRRVCKPASVRPAPGKITFVPSWGYLSLSLPLSRCLWRPSVKSVKVHSRTQPEAQESPLCRGDQGELRPVRLVACRTPPARLPASRMCVYVHV